MAPAAAAMTASIDEDTVDFKPNSDSRETEPVVLPSAIPNLLARVQLRHTGLVFAGIFLLTLQMATMFENSRRLLAGAAQVLGSKEVQVDRKSKVTGEASFDAALD